MAVKVGINGFGRIGRNVVRAGLHDNDIEFVAVNDLTDTKTLAHLLKYDSVLGVAEGRSQGRTDDSITVAGKTIKVFAQKDPAQLDWSSVGAQIVVESTGRFTDAKEACKHIRGTREEGHHLGPGEERRRHHRAGRQRQHVRPGQAQHHLQRVLHHQLPGPGGEGAARHLRHPEGVDDHHPQLHQRPERAGLPAQGPAPRPRRRAQHDPHLHGRRQGHRPGDAGAEGQAGRLLHARPHPGRFRGGPGGDSREGRHRRGSQRRPEGRRRRPAEGHSGLHRRSRWSRPTCCTTRTARSWTG